MMIKTRKAPEPPLVHPDPRAAGPSLEGRPDEPHGRPELEVLGLLVAEIAHEVRNPLASILASLEAWEAEPEEGFEPRGRLFVRVAGRGVYSPDPPTRTEPCRPDARTACLFDGEFEVSGATWDFAFPPAERPLRVMGFEGGRAESDQAVFFESFRPGNFEIGVKMVDACALPPGNPLRAYWAFYGGLTNTEAQVVITRRATGEVHEWSSVGGTFALTEGETGAFPCLD